MKLQSYNCPICNKHPTLLVYYGDKIDDDKEIAYGCLNCKISGEPVVIPASLFMENRDASMKIASIISIARWNKSCEA